MEYVTLGRSGLKISRLGFGGIPIQRIDAAQSQELMNAVRAAGINYIDTARGYTVSEELIGQAIEGHRSEFVLATKSMARDKASMAADIDISLKNLRTDYIDLYQIHNCPPEQLEYVCSPDGALAALQEAKAAGKIKHIGLTTHSLDTFRLALDLDWVETIMFPYNIVENQAEALMAQAKERNIGFIVMKPLAGGAIDNGSLALRYICANPNVTVVIPGMYSVDEVAQNSAAANDPSPLTAEELAEADKIRQELGTNFCRRCNYCAPCTVGIGIPGMFLFQGYLRRYGLEQWAQERYAAAPVKADACVECGVCETRCPYNLPIRSMLKKVAEDFAD